MNTYEKVAILKNQRCAYCDKLESYRSVVDWWCWKSGFPRRPWVAPCKK